MEKSLKEYAYDVLKETKAPLSFKDLFEATLAKAGLTDLSEDEIKVLRSRFYTSITVDGKFFCLQNNTWDLKYRHTEKEVSKALEAAYSDDDSDEEGDEEEEDEDIPDELKKASDDEDEEDDGSDVDYDHAKTSEEF